MLFSYRVLSSILAMGLGLTVTAIAVDDIIDPATIIKETTTPKSYPGFANQKETVSYILGSSIGENIKAQFDTADEKMFAKGIMDNLGKKELAIPMSDHQAIIENFGKKIMAAQTGQPQPETEPLKDYQGFTTDEQKASYVVAVNISDQFKTIPFEFSDSMMVKGFSDSFNGKPLALSDEAQQEIMNTFQTQLAEIMQKEQEEKMTKAAWKTKLEKPEMMTFDSSKDYIWVLQTNKGTVKFKLWPDIAPMHVTSTIFLTKKGFYDDIVFHRVISEFMAQGGCPLGTGTGGPGYKYNGEFNDSVKHDKPYLLSMANAGPGTDGSQFFITFVPTPWLDGKHTLFGEVIEGQKVVDELEKCGSRSGQTSEELKIVKATIEEVEKK